MKPKEIRITPDIAREYLKKNTNNRPVVQRHVNFLASEMANGRWALTHQGILISSDGVLLDGQHRLLAVIQSNATVDMMVTHGAPPEVQLLVDIGSRPRSVADMLHLCDGTMEANIKTAAIRHIVSMSLFFQSYVVSYGISRIVLEEFEKELETVVHLSRDFRPGRKGWIVGTLGFCLAADKRCLPFIEKFCSGENLKSGDPAKTLRDWLLNRSSKHLLKAWRRGAVQCITNAAYNSVTGRDISTIKSGVQGLEFFLGKKRGFVEAIKEQMKQQIQ